MTLDCAKHCLHAKTCRTLGLSLAICRRFIPNVGNADTDEENDILAKHLLGMADRLETNTENENKNNAENEI